LIFLNGTDESKQVINRCWVCTSEYAL